MMQPIPSQKAINLKAYSEFRRAIGIRESSDRYDAINSLGYLGRYQFGLARLSDFGLCYRRDGNSVGFSNHYFGWKQPFSEEDFLSSPSLQDAIFDWHVWLLRNWIERNHGNKMGTTILGITLDLSGCIACCHLVGCGGLNDFLEGKIDFDAFHTRSTDYIQLFSGYEVLSEKPTNDFNALIRTQATS